MISAGKSGPIQRVDHRREVERLRLLANSATTGAIKARLLEQARHHEWLASLEPAASTDLSAPSSASDNRPVQSIGSMNGHDLQSRIDAFRQYVATASGGISIGAALMIVVPVERGTRIAIRRR